MVAGKASEPATELTFDIRRTPFSRFGSYLTFAYLTQADALLGVGLTLRSVHGRGVVRPELFRIDWADGSPIAPEAIRACPSRLTLKHAEGGEVVICIADETTIRLSGTNTPGLRFTMAPGAGVAVHPWDSGEWVVNCRPSFRRYLFEALVGEVMPRVPAENAAPPALDHAAVIIAVLPDARGCLDVAIDEFTSTWVPKARPSFDVCLAEVTDAFDGWLAGMPDVAPEWQATRALAAYVDWSCVVSPSDRLQRPAMLMSKAHMAQVWSWDHCFNAMALSYGHPDLAWDQLMLMADHQDAHGAFPDAVNDFVLHFNFTKPPVHGWALSYMRRQSGAFDRPARLREAYDVFSRWAAWWLAHRVAPGEKLPHYLHGNDSGWDNSTIFDAGTPLIAPDLTALLALHCEELADLARRLGEVVAAEWWRRTSRHLIRDLIDDLWHGDHFVALHPFDHTIVESDSLITCLPIVLGDRLPPEIRTALVRRIERFMTDYGLATELPDGPHYVPDGYWRGPIWAPSTLLIVSGLEAIGETALAREISRRFCRTCAENGFAENFDALTGKGLRDPAYTWTASVFLILAHGLADRRET